MAFIRFSPLGFFQKERRAIRCILASSEGHSRSFHHAVPAHNQDTIHRYAVTLKSNVFMFGLWAISPWTSKKSITTSVPPGGRVSAVSKALAAVARLAADRCLPLMPG
jgi:hypothetical protein